jgi:hypothetical protein
LLLLNIRNINFKLNNMTKQNKNETGKDLISPNVTTGDPVIPTETHTTTGDPAPTEEMGTAVPQDQPEGLEGITGQPGDPGEPGIDPEPQTEKAPETEAPKVKELTVDEKIALYKRSRKAPDTIVQQSNGGLFVSLRTGVVYVPVTIFK